MIMKNHFPMYDGNMGYRVSSGYKIRSKYQHNQRKLLNFVNSHSGEPSQIKASKKCF